MVQAVVAQVVIAVMKIGRKTIEEEVVKTIRERTVVIVEIEIG